MLIQLIVSDCISAVLCNTMAMVRQLLGEMVNSKRTLPPTDLSRSSSCPFLCGRLDGVCQSIAKWEYKRREHWRLLFLE